MRYLSVCSGIDAASVAWKPIGFEPVGFSEIEPFPCAVLATRFPSVTNFGDMSDFHGWKVDPIDILVGGTPCQSFSVAGLRKGLEDPRGNLCLTFLAIAARMRPRWILWENVPGVLSSGGGRDFGSFLGALAQLGYGWAYRVLDAQYFGVPQRRRRVFVVGCSRGWEHSAAVLFERKGLRGNSPAGEKTKQKIARTLRARAHSSHREDSDNFVVANTLPASSGGVSSGMHPIIAVNARQDPDSSFNQIGPLDTDGTTHAIKIVGTLCANGRAAGSATNQDAERGLLIATPGPAYQCHGTNVGQMGTLRTGGHVSSGVPFVTHSLRGEGFDASEDGTGRGTPLISASQNVRRLTPLECERLQGFPDNWTAITYRGKPAKDGPRYKAIGNSMAVVVMRWIGNRLKTANLRFENAEHPAEH